MAAETTKLQKIVGKAVIIHSPTQRTLILRLNADERAKRSTPEREFDEWHIVGGSIEPEDEGSLEKAAAREALEETGLRINVLSKLGVSEWSAFYNGEPADFTATFFLCVPEDEGPDVPDVVLDIESTESAWITKEEVTDYESRGLTKEAQQFIAEGFEKLEESKGKS